MKKHIPLTFMILFFFVSCSVLQRKKDVSTKPLFWNSQRINIDKVGEDIPLQEEISYSQEVVIDTTKAAPTKKKSLSETQDLREVTVTAQRKMTFVPVSEGRVKVQFRIDVPKEVLNDDWRLELTPNVIISDSTVALPNVYIKGDSFLSNQKANYDSYNDYLNSIVPREKYDSAFFDRRKADLFMNRILNQNYTNYKKRFNRQKRIKTWFSMQAESYHNEKMKQRARLEKKRSFWNILVKDRIQQEYNAGKDTIGMYNLYMERINTKIANFEAKDDKMFISEKYYELLYSDYPKNKIFTQKDSINLAEDFYKKDKIILNEDKTKEAENVKKRLIPFYYEEDAKCDTVVSNVENFTYLYEVYIPISKKTKKLKVFVNPTVHATDLSRYNLEPTDTVIYVISSFAQLADASLKYKKTTIHKRARNKYEPQFTFKNNKAEFDINTDTNKGEARKIIDDCNIFTDKGGYIIDSVEIYSYIAPNGQWEQDAVLSKKRAENVKAYFNPRINTTFTSHPKGEDWNALAQLIKEDSHIKNSNEILQLLASATNPDATIAEVKKQYTKDWNYISSSLFSKIERIEMYVNLHHPDAENSTEDIVTTEEEIPNYDKALKYIREQEYWKALEILKDYTDYNTALCLVSLDYNDKALEVLNMLSQTAEAEYLKALVYVRQEQKENAIESLKKTLSLDFTKLSRFKIDEEINTFCINNNLYSQFIK